MKGPGWMDSAADRAGSTKAMALPRRGRKRLSHFCGPYATQRGSVIERDPRCPVWDARTIENFGFKPEAFETKREDRRLRRTGP